MRAGEGGGWLAICSYQAQKEGVVSQTGFEPATRCLEDITVLSAVLRA